MQIPGPMTAPTPPLNPMVNMILHQMQAQQQPMKYMISSKSIQNTDLPHQYTTHKSRLTQMVDEGSVLGSDCQIFQNVAIQDPRNNSDHYMVLGCLRGASPREHTHYLEHRTRLPLHPPGRQMRTQADNIFAEMRGAVLKPEKQAARHNAWISEASWRLFD